MRNPCRSWGTRVTDLFLQDWSGICCWTGDAACGISSDAEKAFDRRREKRKDEKSRSGGTLLLTDLCLALRSDPVGMIRGLGEVVTCVYGPAVTYAFPDPLVAAYRHSVLHVSLISVLDGTALNWCRQQDFRARMSGTVLFGKIKPRANSAQFQGSTTMQDWEKARRSHRSLPENLELEPNSKK